MMVNGFLQPEHQVPLLLTLSVLACFALPLLFALAGSLLLGVPEIRALLCGLHPGTSSS